MNPIKDEEKHFKNGKISGLRIGPQGRWNINDRTAEKIE